VFSSLDTIPTKRPKRSLASNVSALASTAPSNVKKLSRKRFAISLPTLSGCDRFPRCPRRSLDYRRVIRSWFSPMEILTCWRRQSVTTEFRSIM